MTYTLDFALTLGSSQTGLTLEAQLVDTSGANVGSAVTTGFTEIGGGSYLFHYAGFPDGHRGGVIFRVSGGGAFKAFAAINPEEAENTDVKTSSRGTGTALDGAGVRSAVGLASANLDTQLAAIEDQTDEIGAAGAGLINLPWNAAWDAEVQSEAADALNAYDPPTKAELDSAVAPLALQASVDDLEGRLTSARASLLDNLANLDATVSSRLAAAGYTAPANADIATILAAVDTEVAAILAAVDTEVAAIKAKTDNLPAAPAATGDIPTAAAIATQVLDTSVLETGISVRMALRGIARVLLAKVSGAGTTTITFRDLLDTKDSVVATVDASGNRSAFPTRDLT